MSIASIGQSSCCLPIELLNTFYLSAFCKAMVGIIALIALILISIFPTLTQQVCVWIVCLPSRESHSIVGRHKTKIISFLLPVYLLCAIQKVIMSQLVHKSQ